MTHGRFVSGALCALMFAALPASAEIRRVFENPPNEEEVSDVSVVSGWGYSTTGNPVTVEFSIDGGPMDAVPCCGPRADVTAANPGAPLNTSFGVLVNHKNLTLGAHTVAVRFSATGETPVTDTHTVTVVKPGGRSGETPGTIFSFLSDLDVSNANVALDSAAEEFIVAPVTAHDKSPDVGGSGLTRASTLRLAWLNSRQSFNIVSAASGTEFTTVQQLFTQRCALSGCHTGGSPAQQLNLSTNKAFGNLVPIKSTEDSSRFRINPGDTAASYLYQKIIPGGSIIGSRMPLIGGFLSGAEIATIANWINAGAPPPQ
ncbi:MAG: hypothetical protein HYZ50_06225 [Deltaproteobacteria bacterium]|nr:hypothetical protein [Deltaproteobacteria bacterium]